MQRIFLALLIILSTKVMAVDVGASLNIAPTSVYVNQQMGASIAIWNYYRDAGGSITVMDIIPQAWVTVGGSSAVPVGWDKPALGPGQQTTISPGSSVVYWYKGSFFAPSIFPAYTSTYGGGASTITAGTQTYSIGAVVRVSSQPQAVFPIAKEVTVLPLTLPSSQRGFGGN